jgi:hypothetical protein
MKLVLQTKGQKIRFCSQHEIGVANKRSENKILFATSNWCCEQTVGFEDKQNDDLSINDHF